MSLESRAFGSKGAKTSLRETQARPKDYLFALAGVALAAVGTYLVVINRAALDWSEVPFMPGWASVAMVATAAVVFVSFTVAVWRRASME
jgi:hypothetical protein